MCVVCQISRCYQVVAPYLLHQYPYTVITRHLREVFGSVRYGHPARDYTHDNRDFEVYLTVHVTVDITWFPCPTKFIQKSIYRVFHGCLTNATTFGLFNTLKFGFVIIIVINYSFQLKQIFFI